MNEEIIRKMPFSLIAEQSLLGSILIDPDAFNDVADTVSSTDFYITEHTQIYLAMRELFITNSEIDIVTLIDALVRKGIYDKSGGEDYIRTLTQVVPNALNVKDYAKKSRKRAFSADLSPPAARSPTWLTESTNPPLILSTMPKIKYLRLPRDVIPRTSAISVTFLHRSMRIFRHSAPMPSRFRPQKRDSRDLMPFFREWVRATLLSSARDPVWVRRVSF